MRILLIDDDPAVCALIERAFSLRGDRVTVAHSAEAGIHLYSEREFDLLVLDVVLPGMSGTDLLADLRSRGDNVPVILLSGRVSESDVVFGLELGADGYMAKPFSGEELKARAWALVRRVRMEHDSSDHLSFIDLGSRYIEN